MGQTLSGDKVKTVLILRNSLMRVRQEKNLCNEYCIFVDLYGDSMASVLSTSASRKALARKFRDAAKKLEAIS